MVIADLFPERIPAGQRLDPRRVAAELVAAGVPAQFIPMVDEIIEVILPELSSGDVICVMSRGGFGDLPAKLLAALEGHGQGSR